jgi:tripartite motif-containing protein 2/3
MSLKRSGTVSIPVTFRKLKELVTCAVCLKLFENPKVLPCLHSYCYKCIEGLSQSENGFKCPECRDPVDVR